MKVLKRILTSIAVSLLIAGQCFAAAGENLAVIYGLYKQGAYSLAIEKLTRFKAETKTRAVAEYWIGLCQNRLQSFDAAIISFNNAIKAGINAEDIYYELGQAYYATKDLRAARETFRRSIAKGFKPGPSYYYVGFTSQVLEDYEVA